MFWPVPIIEGVRWVFPPLILVPKSAENQPNKQSDERFSKINNKIQELIDDIQIYTIHTIQPEIR